LVVNSQWQKHATETRRNVLLAGLWSGWPSP